MANGDADGLCALQQLRLAHPRAATLVTGVKRDISLLQRVRAGAGDAVAVLDISVDRNEAALLRLLAAGARVLYVDHHHAARPPGHPNLRLVLDTRHGTCTSALVDGLLGGRHRAWAAVGAFGDALAPLGQRFAADCGYAPADIARLQALGEAINHNAYGESPADLLIEPAALFARMQAHADPLAFITSDPVAPELVAQRDGDLARALAVPASHASARTRLHQLPDAAWARRAHGPLANVLADRDPARAVAEIGRAHV